MMSISTNELLPAEIQAMSACMEDAYNLLGVFQYWKTLSVAPLLFNGAISDTSMYVIESYGFLTATFPELKEEINTQEIEILRKSRHRGKVFDYAKDINDSFDDFVQIYETQQKEFLSEHTGLFGKIKRIIQPDTGLTKYNGHFITTTLSTLFDFSTQNLTPDIALRYGINYGEFLSTVLNFFGKEYPTLQCNLSENFNLIDIKGQQLFKRIKFQQKNEVYAIALTLMMTKLNFIQYIWSVSLPTDSHMLFRIKFINSYHIAHNLSKMQSIIMSNNPSETEKQILIDLNNDKNIKWLKKQSQLRNLITHYNVEDNKVSMVKDGMTRIETIELFSKQKTFSEINSMIDEYIVNTAKRIENYFKLDENTFWYGNVD